MGFELFKVVNKYLPLIEDREHITLLYGGRGSGKSYFVAEKILLQCYAEPGHRYLVMHKFYSSIKETVFSLFVDIINEYNLNEYFIVHQSPFEIICRKNGNQIIFKGLDKSEKAKSITGITDAWLEEATFFTKSDFTTLTKSIRGRTKYPIQIILTFNPIDKSNWIYQTFWVGDDYKHKKIHTTYKDNPYLTDHDLEMLFADATNYQVDVEGIWGERSNTTIYTNWKVDPSVSGDPRDYDLIRGGVDFGYNDGKAVVLSHFRGNTITIVKEYYKKYQLFNAFTDELKATLPMNVNYICDSQGREFVEMMKHEGIKAYSVKKPEIYPSISWMQCREVLIHPSCVNFKREIENYQWRVNPHNEEDIMNEPVGGNDHLLDAWRYSYADKLKKDRKRMTLSKIRF